ncbi:MT-A70 family protein [Trichomonas vaginalis G3]|uniref:mRNA m(6)A methyltransferase n=1 Tax=Trichomonas vaginalis (strain ATCC PRA-98 / G3) TaxID=412133 RepID=A2E165_TRIV3|nr:primary miRNA methylation [Trichomonas vaginalis G3]EAY13566.1 MT-A70 family protein [Trichomonas vaginalis G3]KAI5486394.1 primary miRNA methylation [Trichomonas vaginalis G3]|eukprot:XP_001325789.1 MT-A70 family protein [Trichomonas vaginalis G3]
MSSRGIACVPYADWMEDSDDIGDDDSDEFTGCCYSYKYSGKYSKYRKNGEVKYRREIPIEAIKSQYMSENDPRTKFDPDGNPCRFIKFEDLIKNKYELGKLFLKDQKGINTLMPHETKPENFLSLLNIESEVIKFTNSEIAEMTDEQLHGELDRVNKELEIQMDFEGLNNDFVVIPPYDERIENSISIRADITMFDWKALGSRCKFDVIIMDPPWMIQPGQVTRGVSLDYNLLEAARIEKMPLKLVQDNGYCLMWVVASMLSTGIKMMKTWGYSIVSFGNWVKISKFGRYSPSNGYFLQHCKETFIIGVKGKPIDGANLDAYSDIILSERARSLRSCMRSWRKCFLEECTWKFLLELII